MSRSYGMRTMRVLALLALATGLTGCFDPIVGYPCAPGYTACGEICVDLRTSAQNCGACGTSCAGSCQAAVCVVASEPDAGAGGSGGQAGADANLADANVDRPAGPDGKDAPALDAGLDVAPADAADTTPADGPSPEVAPDAPVAPEGDASAPADAPAAEVLLCDPGFTACTDRCVELPEDPDNCGVCGRRCASGLCAAGLCLQEGAGHLVAIGHDYAMNRSGMNNLLGNAVFLSGSDPVSILAFEGDASPGAIAGTHAAINQVAAERSRRWTRTVATTGSLAAQLPSHDVLLIYAQDGSSDVALISRGVAFAAAMDAFVTAGKTIVLLEGVAPGNQGTHQILTAAGLLLAAGRSEVTGDILEVVNPADAVAVRVPRSYRAEMASASFLSLEPGKVVATPLGAPVVIHKTF